jgi:hypothetical protein
MSTCDLLPRLGLFVVNCFFDAEWRARVPAELREAESKPAPVYSEKQVAVNRSIQSTTVVHVTAPTGTLVHARLAALQPALESYFRVPVQGSDDIHCLRYRAGKEVSSSPFAPTCCTRSRP